VDARGHRYERPLERMRAYLDAMDAAPWQGPPLEKDPAEARRIGREYVAFYLTLPNYARAWERAGFGPEELGNGGSDRLVDAMVAWGSPEAIADRAQAHLDAGADHVCLQVLDADPNALPVGAWRALAPAVAGR